MIYQHKIVFDKLCLDDAEFLFNLFQDDDNDKIFYEKASSIDSWKKRILEIIKQDNNYQYIIKLIDSKHPIGWLGYHILDNDNGSINLQIMVIEKQYQHIGYGSEAIEILKQQLINKNINKIRVWTQETNKKAISFYLKHGFIKIGSKLEEVDWGRKFEQFAIMEFQF